MMANQRSPPLPNRGRAEARPHYDPPVHPGGFALDNHQGAGDPDHGRGTATSARPVGPGKGAAAALPNDAMKIVARGADKEDHAAVA